MCGRVWWHCDRAACICVRALCACAHGSPLRRVVHNVRVDLLTAVALGTFSRNKSAVQDMKNPHCVRQAEIAVCLLRLGVSNGWVWARVNRPDTRDKVFTRPRTPRVSTTGTSIP